ncbi:MAG: polysaccharide deacetylase family protein [Candidatus Zixiibacteriota bacterium]|nr:MAG: polysaccharide deacetylase family protein [candidate division Zixibacteria bacterium]
MKKLCFTAFVAAVLTLSTVCPVSGQTSEKKEGKKKTEIKIKKMCITFDNLPGERNYSQAERQVINDTILAVLKEHDARASGFVVGDNIESGWEIIVRWLDEGHTIGFMTYTGQDVDNVPPEIFIEDIAKGKETIEDIVATYKQKERFFRFPYLHYGSRPEIKQEVEDYLDESMIGVAHASIVVEDFVYNLSLEKITNSRDSTKFIAVRDEYITHILERLGYAETLAQEVMGRPIRHILQLRINWLNAMFLDDVLTVLTDKGYSFISLKDALKDKIYRKPEAYFGLRGVSYQERLKYSDPDLLPASD